MPISAQVFLRSNLLLIAAGVLALLAIVAASVWLVGRTQHEVDEVLKAREMRSAIADLKSLTQDAETGQRGYLLTAEPPYLAPYSGTRNLIPPKLEQVEKLAARYPDMVAPVAALAKTIADKLAELDHTIELERGGDHAGAMAIVRSNVGKSLMDRARSGFDGLIEQADRQLINHVSTQRESAVALRWVTSIGALVILAVVGAAVWLILRYTRELGEARSTVETLNVGLEERVRERTTELARANDEIQRFAYIVTHDLRAPLVNIMGFTSELETSLAPIKSLVEALESKGTEVPAEAKAAAEEDLPEAIGFIRSSTRKMDGLINAILKLSRDGRRPLKQERIDLGKLVGQAVAAVQHQLDEAGGRVELALAVPPIYSDRLSLEQAFGNLLDNALKYRDDSRPLTIRVTSAPEKANRVRVEFADNGRGIAAQDHDRVFELFRRSGAQDKAGEGIGLAYVRSALRNIGGDITLTSELGKGTTFIVTLPRDLNAVTRRAQ